jgi:RNA polymerase sigma-70 factor (ECF subfamily)
MRKRAAERSDGKQTAQSSQQTGKQPSPAYAPPHPAAKAKTLEERFEELYRHLYPLGVRFALTIMPGRDTGDDAEDAVQNVLIQLWKKCEADPGTLAKPLAELEAYMIQGVKNQQKMSLRGTGRFAAALGVLIHEAQRWLEDWKRPWNDLGREELRAVIQREVDRLPMECREVFHLVRFEGLNYKDVAIRLGRSIGEVHGELSKANAILRAQLSEYHAPDGGWPMWDPDVRIRDTRNHDDV